MIWSFDFWPCASTSAQSQTAHPAPAKGKGRGCFFGISPSPVFFRLTLHSRRAGFFNFSQLRVCPETHPALERACELPCEAGARLDLLDYGKTVRRIARAVAFAAASSLERYPDIER